MGFQVWSWFLGLGLTAWLALIAGAKTIGDAAYNVWGDEEEQRPQGQYRRSQFMPPPPGAEDQMARYAPENRPVRSGVSPDIMAYLRKYIR
jgi:hypothetical protein